MRSFDMGDELVFAATFADPTTQQPKNPDTVTLTLRDPHGNYEPVIVAPLGVGNYRGKFTPSLAGLWAIRWQGTGAVMAATEYQFEVRPSAFPGG